MDALANEVTEEFRKLHDRMRRVIKDLDAVALNKAPAEGENSIAVLVTHVLGSELGWLHRAAAIPFTRDRGSEFRAKASEADLAAKIDSTEPQVRDLLAKSEAAGFGTMRTFDDGRQQSVGSCVTYVLSHTAEHVGHAELTRVLLSKRR